MKIKKISIPRPALEYLESEGFTELYPPQADCIRAGLLDGESLLVSAPTASGKTLIAMLAMIKHLSERPGKIIYLSPLRALAAEKFAEFKKLENVDLRRRIRVGISTGDFDGPDRRLAGSDILVLTNEKMDALVRHGTGWIKEIGLVIADEVHLIGDPTRGPTLEMVLTRLKLMENRPQIVGLSATVTNSKDIAGWLGCKLVRNDWRPVPLTEGVSDEDRVTMTDGTEFEFKRTVRGSAVDLGVQCVADGGQSLIFANTRARSKSLAAKAADAVYKELNKSEVEALGKASAKILADNDNTEMVKALAELVKKGVAFHHAGLNQDCRSAVEAEFRRGTIKLLSSTPTLAAGVNLPARRVVISSVTRYDARQGRNVPISVLEYKQLCGRAGRPQFDSYGQAIIVGNGNTDEMLDWYPHGEPEPIESTITGDKALQAHLLAVIVDHPGIKKAELVSFFMQTLGGFQSSKGTVKFALDLAVMSLFNMEMIQEEDGAYTATGLGRKANMLYIHPDTALHFKAGIDAASKGRGHAFGFLHLISSCDEFFPSFSLRSADQDKAGIAIERNSRQLLGRITEYDCSRSLLALLDWISETSELSLSENLGIESGDMHHIVESADRLAYCLLEIARYMKRNDLLPELATLRVRITYGVKAELAGLVRVKGIGRVRARALYRRGIRDIDSLAAMPTADLARIGRIGSKTAVKIKSELRKGRH